MGDRRPRPGEHADCAACARRDGFTRLHGEIAGIVGSHVCRPGIAVHASDTVAAADLRHEMACGPGLILAVMLKGRLDLAFGGERVTLGAAPGEGVRGHLLWFAAATPAVRIVRAGERVRKAMVCVLPEWLEAMDREAFRSAPHLAELTAAPWAARRWTPSRRAQALAEQMFHPCEESPLLRAMCTECRAIDLLAEAVAQLSAAERPAVRPATALKIRDVRDHLLADVGAAFDLRDLARRFGMSPEALQRSFKHHYGQPVGAFVRQARLARAREAIARDGLTVGQAAYLAGYTNPANFATAFKRMFGVSPSEVRS